MSSVRTLLGGKEKEPTIADELGCGSMSYEDRVKGFGICFIIGFGLSVLSGFFVIDLARGEPAPFAVCYTLGNICAICSTFFVMGPMKQLKRMVDPTRLVASAVFVVAMIGTVVAAFVAESVALVIICIVVQFCAGFWYGLSYIPYARTCVKNMFASAIV